MQSSRDLDPEVVESQFMERKKRIALVEDDGGIAYSIQFNLESAGLYQVEHFESGHDALDALVRSPFDLLILDIGLPDIDGLAVCKELRAFEATRQLPIIMLTARVTERDRVRGLNVGADDYVSKPFSMPELVARVGAQLRRAAMGESPSDGVFDDGHLKVDVSEHRVRVGALDVKLTKKEFELLWLLVTSRPRVLNRSSILEKVWEYDPGVDTRTIDVHIRSLRKKIGEEYIETVIGIGYRFQDREVSRAV